jgi:hypothetical protein
MASCKRFKALTNLYLDGEADDGQTQMLFSHMEGCERCRNRFEEIRNLHSAIRSVPTVDLPDGFRSAVIARIQSDVQATRRIAPTRRRFIGFPVTGWAGAAATILLIFAIGWYIHNPEPALAVPEIHIVSPRVDAVVEQQYVDISAAFTSGDLKNVRVILDSKDVTEATEVNEDFLIYTSDALQSGHHMATVQITDSKGVPISQRSWAFYVMRSESS